MKLKKIKLILLTSMVLAIPVISLADNFYSKQTVLNTKSNKRVTSPIIVFVSFSMSEVSLKQWMRQAEMIRAPVVIRGLINNSFKETIQKMADMTKDNHGGVQLDPTLFRRFQITQVPAVVVWKEASCLENQSCLENYDVIYGDVTLDYALKKIADQNDAVSMEASRAYSRLRGNPHE